MSHTEPLVQEEVVATAMASTDTIPRESSIGSFPSHCRAYVIQQTSIPRLDASRATFLLVGHSNEFSQISHPLLWIYSRTHHVGKDGRIDSP